MFWKNSKTFKCSCTKGDAHLLALLSPTLLKQLLIFLLRVRPSLTSLHTQQSKSPEMICSDQRVSIIHPASVGLFCIPDSQPDWIFHLHTRLLSNVTHTSLKQHCHSPLASSIFPYWHFLVCLEQECEGKTSKWILFLLFSASRRENSKEGFCFVDRNRDWPFLCREPTVIAFWYR